MNRRARQTSAQAFAAAMLGIAAYRLAQLPALGDIFAALVAVIVSALFALLLGWKSGPRQ